MNTRYLGCLIAICVAIIFAGCDQPEVVRAENSAMVVVTSKNFESVVLNSDKPVLLDFWADWCRPCRALMPTMEELAEKHKGEIVIGKVDVDKEKDLARKFEVSQIPRLIYFKQGEIIIENGSTSKSEIEKQIASVTKLQ